MNFYSRIFDSSGWKELVNVYSGKQTYPNVEIASGSKGEIYLLLGKVKGAFDQLLLKACDNGK